MSPLFLRLLPILFLNLPFAFSNPATPLYRENKGQVGDQFGYPRNDVLFSGSNGHSTFHLLSTSISYQFVEVVNWKEKMNLKTHKLERSPALSNIYRLDLQWLGANSNHKVRTGELAPGYDNFYSHVCPNGITQVKSFSDLWYDDLYPGIQVHFYEKNGAMKYDYVLSPGTDYHQILIKVEGAKTIKIGRSGELIIECPLGTISEPSPLVMQNGKQLKANWKVQSNFVSFEIQGVDPSKVLLIDPLVRAWGTYYGNATGSDGSQIYGTCVDLLNNVYVAGASTTTGLLMATTGSHQQNYAGGGDAFLAKFAGNGQRIWATLYGGSNAESGYDCATDLTGNVYLTGISGSSGPAPGNGIATTGSHQSSLNTVWQNGFLAKFNSAGIRIWGTFYGGSLNENVYACTTDAQGNVFIAGQAESSNGIATNGAYQSVFGGHSDAFIAKFDSNGVRQWGTYLGGSYSMAAEAGLSCATDPAGNVYLGGELSPGAPLFSAGGFQANYIGGDNDGFVAKFSPGGAPLWASYYGINMAFGNDEVVECVTDQAGNVYLTGNLTAPPAFTFTPPPPVPASSLIATPGTYMSQPNPTSGYNTYLAKFNANGQRQWGTFFGNNSFAGCCSIDANGKLFLGGMSNGTIGVTPGCHQPNPTPLGDAHFAEFDQSGALLYASYYGGAREEQAFSCVNDGVGNFFLAGFSNSFGGTSIATANGHQPSYPGTNLDGAPNSFLAKFSRCNSLNTTFNQTQPTCFGSANGSASMTASAGGDGITYLWLPGGSTGPALTSLAAGNYTCIVNTSCGVSLSYPFSITNPPAITLSLLSLNNPACAGSLVTFSVNGGGGTGALNYTWLGGATINGPNTATVLASANMLYSVTATDANSCTANSSVLQNVSECLGFEELKDGVEVSIYPNPSTGWITVKTKIPGHLRLFDATGRLIRVEKMEHDETKIDLRGCAAGIYILRFENKHNQLLVLEK